MNKRRKEGFLFKLYRFVIGPFFRKCKYEGIEKIDEPCIIISNHIGATGPAQYSFYYPYQHKIWANGEFFHSLKSTYHALYNFFRIKKKKSKFASWLISLIGTPWFHLDIKISQVIPVYSDARFYITVSKSIEELESGGTVIIFPEQSKDGYQDDMTLLMPGFLYLLNYLDAKGMNVPVISAFILKKKRTINLGDKVYYQELKEKGLSQEEMLQFFVDKMNELNTSLINE